MSKSARRHVAHAVSELETLDGMLQYCQQTLLVKIDGLGEEDLRRPQVPSGTTLLGMVKHLGYAHRWWFRIVFADEAVDVPWTADDPAAVRFGPGDDRRQQWFIVARAIRERLRHRDHPNGLLDAAVEQGLEVEDSGAGVRGAEVDADEVAGRRGQAAVGRDLLAQPDEGGFDGLWFSNSPHDAVSTIAAERTSSVRVTA